MEGQKIYRKVEYDQYGYKVLQEHPEWLLPWVLAQAQKRWQIHVNTRTACVHSMCGRSFLTRVRTVKQREGALCALNTYYIFRKLKMDVWTTRKNVYHGWEPAEAWELKETKFTTLSGILVPCQSDVITDACVKYQILGKPHRNQNAKYVCRSLTMWWTHIYLECLKGSSEHSWLHLTEYPQ